MQASMSVTCNNDHATYSSIVRIAIVSMIVFIVSIVGTGIIIMIV